MTKICRACFCSLDQGYVLQMQSLCLPWCQVELQEVLCKGYSNGDNQLQARNLACEHTILLCGNICSSLWPRHGVPHQSKPAGGTDAIFNGAEAL